MRYLLVALTLLSGCASTRHEIKVLRSKTEIQVHTLSIEDGEVVVCDSERCRVVQP